MMLAGRDLNQFVSELIWYLRGLMLMDASGNGSDLLDVSKEQLSKMQEEAKRVDVETLIRYIRILSDLANQMRYSTQKRVLVEVTIIQLCMPQMDAKQDLSTLEQRMQILEKKIEEGIVVEKQVVQTESQKENDVRCV